LEAAAADEEPAAALLGGDVLDVCSAINGALDAAKASAEDYIAAAAAEDAAEDGAAA